MESALRKTNELINKYNIRANKRFGQNFLINDTILDEIIKISEINNDDLIIEIGPGLGNLTEYILKYAKYALLVEIDKNMIQIIEDRFKDKNNYVLLNEDILKIDLDKFINELEEKNKIKFNNIKIVANLPYYITTPILFKLLENETRITEIIVMVQKEVAQRMVAIPKTKDYGILSIMTQYLSIPEIKINVPSASFIPAPNVESTVIKLKKEKRYLVDNEDIFLRLVHASFSMRRKKMINSLYNTNFMNLDKEIIEEIFSSCKISLNVRAEELSIEEFIKIANEIYKRG